MPHAVKRRNAADQWLGDPDVPERWIDYAGLDVYRDCDGILSKCPDTEIGWQSRSVMLRVAFIRVRRVLIVMLTTSSGGGIRGCT